MIDRNFKKELKGRESRLKGNALHLQVLIEKIYSLERYMIKNPFRTDDDNDVFHNRSGARPFLQSQAMGLIKF